MKNEIESSKIDEKIIELLENENLSMSIRKITERLDKDYGIKRSPQIIFRHLKKLKQTGKLTEK